MAQIGEISTVVTAKTAPFSRGMSRAKNDAKGFSKTIRGRVTGSLRSLGRTLTSTKSMILGLGTAIGAAGLVRKSVKLAAEAESMRVSYATFLKSMDKAKETLKELDKYSAATPFQSGDVKEAGKQLLAFGFEAEKLMDYIKVIGNLAAGSQKPMNDFVDILGKVRASGVASMADVNRMADRGVPIYQNLAKAMDVAKEEVRGLVSTAKVGFPEMWKAVRMATEEGGLFAGAVENLSKTTLGKMSTLRDNVDKIFRDVGTAILEGLDIKSLSDKLTKTAKIYRQDIVDATVAGVEGLVSAVRGIGELTRKGKTFWDRLKLTGMSWKGWYLRERMQDFAPGSEQRRAYQQRFFVNERSMNALRRNAEIQQAQRASAGLSAETDKRAARIQRSWERYNLPVNQATRQRMLETGPERAAQAERRRAKKAEEQRQAMIEEQRKTREAMAEQDRAAQMEQLIIGRF